MFFQKDRKRQACLIAASVGVLLIYPVFLFAAVMQSSGYKIQTDSINIGGNLSSSTSYISEDTLGEVGTGISSSTSFDLSAGYQALQSNYIAISVSSSSIPLPDIGGISGGNTTGSDIWTVVTDDPAGYQMTIVASTSPTLRSASSSISDYLPSGSAPDFLFSVGAASSTFGFSPEGVDITQTYKDNGTACNTGSNDTTDRCWDGISTSPKTIAQRTSANQPNGSTTTIEYQVGIGSNKIQDAGAYSANVTITATAL